MWFNIEPLQEQISAPAAKAFGWTIYSYLNSVLKF